jgi:hypothetical protein
MVAIAIVAYFCAFPELAALLGIFAASVLFVAPIVGLMYIVCRVALRSRF